jgi:Protein of unknown function/Domain of unknown function (DUF1835)
MAITHIIVGEQNSKPLIAAQELDESLAGEILVLKDQLGLGPIHLAEGETMDTARSAFWISLNGLEDFKIEDSQKVQILADQVTEEDQVWFWFAPNVSDACAFFWLLSFFQNKPGVLHTISIGGLPFFNEKGTLYYPSQFSSVLPREMVKCKKLLKDISPADYEIDGDDWPNLTGENALVRTFEGGKKVISRNDSHYDTVLLNQLQFAQGWTKASKLLSHAIAKINDPINEQFMEKRFRLLIEDGKILVQGDATKALKDFEVTRFGT